MLDYIGPFQLMILIILAVFLIWFIVRVITWAIRSIIKASKETTKESSDDPLNVLKLRLSKGEITETQFESMKKQITQ